MSMPRAVRHINETRVLAALYRLGVATRADLARELGLTRSTVGNLVAGLIEVGMLMETDAHAQSNGRSGRPGQDVRLNPSHSAVIGVDIGVGHLSVVAVDMTGRPVQSRTVDYEGRAADVDQTLKQLAAMIKALVRHLPPSQHVQGLCAVAPGLVDRESSVVVRAPVLGWNDVPVAQLLRDLLDWPGVVALENDANAFAAAELYGPTGVPGSQNALFVYLDAGVGGGIVSQGRLMRGQNGYAGEIGHLYVGDKGFDPKSTLPGSLESYIGRSAILVRYRHHGGGGRALPEFMADLAVGKAPALEAASEWAWWLGRGLASSISVLDPARVVLGGPVAQLYPFVEDKVAQSMREHLVPACPLPVVEISTLASDACAIGAAMMLHHDLLAIDEELVFGASDPSA